MASTELFLAHSFCELQTQLNAFTKGALLWFRLQMRFTRAHQSAVALWRHIADFLNDHLQVPQAAASSHESLL